MLFGMLALFLLPTTQELDTANQSVKTNYQTIQQQELNQLELAIIQQDKWFIASFRPIEIPNFLQNVPHFVAKIFVRQCPIRAGPVTEFIVV